MSKTADEPSIDEVQVLANLVQYQDGAVVSRTLIKAIPTTSSDSPI